MVALTHLGALFYWKQENILVFSGNLLCKDYSIYRLLFCVLQNVSHVRRGKTRKYEVWNLDLNIARGTTDPEIYFATRVLSIEISHLKCIQILLKL